MSFWGKLAKIGGFAAAPFTGGASIAIGNGIGSALDAIGQGAGGAANSMAGNRQAQFGADLQSNDAYERELMARELNRRQDNSANMKHALAASMLMGYHPAQRPAGMPNAFAGGLGPIGGEAAAFQASDALQRLKAGDQLPALQRVQMQQPGFWEKFLNIASPIASTGGKILNGLGNNGGSAGDGEDFEF